MRREAVRKRGKAEPSRWCDWYAFAARFSLVIISALSTRELYLRGRGVVIIVGVIGDAAAVYGEERALRNRALRNRALRASPERIGRYVRGTYDDRVHVCARSGTRCLGNSGWFPARNAALKRAHVWRKVYLPRWLQQELLMRAIISSEPRVFI